MEEFMEKVRSYASAVGIEPTTVVQRGGNLSGTTWAKWVSGESSPTMRKADKILKYMADNPPVEARSESCAMREVG